MHRAHVNNGLDSQRDALVKQTMEGIRRIREIPRRQAKALLSDDLLESS